MYGGSFAGMAGTSASCPVVAGFISNINAARMAIGKGAVGWINPALYAHSASFVNDIVTGDNKCSATAPCCPHGFTAVTGWDPASGLGSVNYAKMQAKFVSLGGTNAMTATPTAMPTALPSAIPTTAPTKMPTAVPTAMPTVAPSRRTSAPTYRPRPSRRPTTRRLPSAKPTKSSQRSAAPTIKPSPMRAIPLTPFRKPVPPF